MDLMNTTSTDRVGEYDGVSYRLPARKVTEVPDEAGVHICMKLRRFGIVQVRFGDERKNIELQGLREYRFSLKRGLEVAKRVNKDLENRNMNPLPPDGMVETASRELPVIEKRIEQLEKELRKETAPPELTDIADDDNEDDAEGEAQLPEQPSATELDAMEGDELREFAAMCGVQAHGNWKDETVRRKIIEVYEES